MGGLKKRDMLNTIRLLEEANTEWSKKTILSDVEDLFSQCQESAILLGNHLETMYTEAEQGTVKELITLLEDYCEEVYQISTDADNEKQVRKIAKKITGQLSRIRNLIKYDLPEDRREVVFLPYKASMWDSLESVWKAADADPDCDAYVIPIPYFDKNPDGSFREMHYEGGQYPDYVPVISYEAYDFEKRCPDMIFIHNPYDECNHVSSVHPFFYTKNLKKFTERLIYIPYFTLGEGMYAEFCVSPGTLYADVVIAHSEQAKEDYVKHLCEAFAIETEAQRRELRRQLANKILPLGSPKIDKVVNGDRSLYPLPEAWKTLLAGKKAVLYNTGVSGILHGNEQELLKIIDTIRFFRGRDDVVLWWRPHPLTGGTMQSMRPALVEEYQKIVAEYKASGSGIFDDTADLHRAVLWTDMYYGDDSSLVYLYGVQGKPIVMQNIGFLTEKIEKEKNNGICHKVSCTVSTKVYFTPLNYNRLYQLDLIQKVITDMGEIPQEWQMEISLYSNLIYKEGVLWFVPSRAHAIAGYHLNTGKWERYELPDRIRSSTEIDGMIYMISSDYRHLWIMNLKERRLEREEISYDWEEKFPLSDEYYNDDLYIIESKLYYLITHSNLVAVYDLKNKQTELFPISTQESRYQRMLHDENGFWMIPRDKRNRIVCWSEGTVRESGENCYPDDFSCEWGFSHAVFRNGGIWLFPLKGNMILSLDQKNMTTVCALMFEEERNVMDVQMLPGNRLAFFTTDSLSQTDCRMTVLDAEDRILEELAISYPDNCQITADNLFERLDMEKYHSVSAYQIKETVENSLSRLCDTLGKERRINREEQNYFRNLYANSDGTAGTLIWEEVKTW